MKHIKLVVIEWKDGTDWDYALFLDDKFISAPFNKVEWDDIEGIVTDTLNALDISYTKGATIRIRPWDLKEVGLKFKGLSWEAIERMIRYFPFCWKCGSRETPCKCPPGEGR